MTIQESPQAEIFADEDDDENSVEREGWMLRQRGRLHLRATEKPAREAIENGTLTRKILMDTIAALKTALKSVECLDIHLQPQESAIYLSELKFKLRRFEDAPNIRRDAVKSTNTPPEPSPVIEDSLEQALIRKVTLSMRTAATLIGAGINSENRLVNAETDLTEVGQTPKIITLKQLINKLRNATNTDSAHQITQEMLALTTNSQ